MTDLTARLTVFVITVGEPSTQACIDALNAQTCTFQLKVIRNTTPMWKAFQRMLDECSTPFYVQVDADMILKPTSIQALYDAITSRSDRVAEYVAWLWDTDIKRHIQGVKIYRHAATSLYPYQESMSCEMVQVGQLQADGFEIVSGPETTTEEECAGLHMPTQTPALAYQRWQRLMQKHRKYPWMAWLADYPKRLMGEWQANPHEINQARFLGAMAGLTGPLPPDKEMDASQANQDYRRMAAYVGEYSQGPREITLYVTDRCNFRCVFNGNPCMRETPEGVPKNGELEVGTVQRVLDKWPSIRGACIAGFGEPLLYRQLEELVGMLHQRGVFVGLITNGALLHQKAEMVKTLPLTYLSVSLNAINPEQHQVVTRTTAWNKVLDGIRIMAASPVRTGLSYVVTQKNVGDIPEMLRQGRELGVKFIHLHNILPHVSPDDATFRESVLTVDSFEALEAIEQAKKLPGAELIEVWPEIIDLNSPPPGKCMSPLVSMGFDAFGAVSGCRRVDPPTKGVCHIDWPDPWNSVHYTSLRLTVIGDQQTHPACRGCFGNWKG